MILIFIITTVIIFLVVFGFIMEIHRLQDEVEKNEKLIDELQTRLAFAGKNYVDKTNDLRDKIQKLELKSIDQNNSISKYKEMYVKEKNKKGKNNEVLCKSSKKNSVKLGKRKR